MGLISFISWSATAAPNLAEAVRLLIAVVIGALTYVSVILSAWVLAGRPAGAEQYIQDRLSKMRGRTIEPESREQSAS